MIWRSIWSVMAVRMYKRIGKRAFDLLVSFVLVVLLAPLLLVLSLLVWLSMGLPILFRQTRPGYQARLFDILKFRSMSDLRDENGVHLPDGDRITRVGQLLRRTSLDELPELLNVIRGDMSLVGPRPLLVQYLPLYSEQQMRRHEIKPGITGWVQINGRNAMSWEEKFRLDTWYVDNMSFGLDLKILVLTIWKVLMREGISQPGYATAEFFRGSETLKTSD